MYGIHALIEDYLTLDLTKIELDILLRLEESVSVCILGLSDGNM